MVVHDPIANTVEAQTEYGISLVPWEEIGTVDGLILAVGHKEYRDQSTQSLTAHLSGRPQGGVFMDVKGVVKQSALPENIHYWRL